MCHAINIEAEYVAMGDGVREGLFVRNVISFLMSGWDVGGITLLEDNEGARALAENPLSSSKSKHRDA